MAPNTATTATVAVAKANASIFSTLAKSLTSAANKLTTTVGLTKAQAGGAKRKRKSKAKKATVKPKTHKKKATKKHHRK